VAEMSVELVAVERKVWSGHATSVFAETTDGETVTAAVFGGFLSVTGEKVSVLAEAAELSDEIDPQAARDALAQADAEEDQDRAVSVRARATARLKAVGQDV